MSPTASLGVPGLAGDVQRVAVAGRGVPGVVQSWVTREDAIPGTNQGQIQGQIQEYTIKLRLIGSYGRLTKNI